MKKMFLSICFFVIISCKSGILNSAHAQCAMCRATVESSTKNSDGIGKGINSGILYLMIIPYIMAAGIGYFWYKQSTKETSKLNKIEDVLRRKLS